VSLRTGRKRRLKLQKAHYQGELDITAAAYDPGTDRLLLSSLAHSGYVVEVVRIVVELRRRSRGLMVRR